MNEAPVDGGYKFCFEFCVRVSEKKKKKPTLQDGSIQTPPLRFNKSERVELTKGEKTEAQNHPPTTIQPYSTTISTVSLFDAPAQLLS